MHPLLNRRDFLSRTATGLGGIALTHLLGGDGLLAAPGPIIDATRPYEWRDKFPKSSGASRELKDKVADEWKTFLDQKFGRR